MMRFALSAGAVVLFSAGASAGISFSIEVSNIVSPESPWATVEVWAHFDQDQYAFAGAGFDVVAESDLGGLAVPQSVLDAVGTRDGDMSQDSDRVSTIVAGQLLFPPGGYFVNTSNPILVWRAKWTTWDFSPRLVDIATETAKFLLYVDANGTNQDFRKLGFSEGKSAIQVVPCAGVLAGLVVGAGMLAGGSRRRS